jgi:TolB-like protein/DNA-binding winged helix-turn-helix (wHTH) protein
MRYHFDKFDLCADRFELKRDGAVEHVEPLVFDLLHFFAARPCRVIGRDEIIAHVWQGRIVSDATVSGCIKAARRALGDDGDSQTYIRTVRGRGYEFTGSVTTTPPLDDGQTPPGPEGPPSERGVGASLGDATPPPLPAAASPSPWPVVAVLPLANLSICTEDYFADRLTEDIITNLARFRDLRVIAGATTLQFKGRAADPRETCRALDASHAVRGSVRRAAGRVRISVELVDGATGHQIWGERYDRDMGDLFDLQDEVTRTIAAALGAKVHDGALRRAMSKKPHELDAYDCLLRARRYTASLSADMHAEARDLLERAVELDPLSADAHALLANVYLAEHRFEMNPRPNPVGRALTHALAATSLDPQNAYARCWLAIVHFFRGENDRFEAEAMRAVELNPNDPETLADVGHYLAFMGEFERGVALSRRAQTLNPLHAGWYFFSFARRSYSRRDYAGAIAEVGRIGLPHFYWSHLLDAAAKGQIGHPDASAALARMHDVKPGVVPCDELRKWNAAPDDLAHILDGIEKAARPG